MVEFEYSEILSLNEDETLYKIISKDYIFTDEYKGHKILNIEYTGLKLIAEQAFTEVSYFLRSSHLKFLKNIMTDNESSENDRYVASELLKNAKIASEKEFPLCQDTGTAIIIAKKGQKVWTNFCDAKALSEGIYNAYKNNYLRFSQNSPISMYDEINTGTNLPAQIDIEATTGSIYDFLFIAKGGGSANKTFLMQETKALLNPVNLLNFIESKIKNLGTSACPPYHLAIVIGGTSSEFNLKVVKLASARYLDNLSQTGGSLGQGFRDIALENKILKLSQNLNIGAQFGGKHFCLDVRVIRLPRHGASCPVGIGVSCSADRNLKGKITKDGIFLEKLEENPAKFIPRKENLKTSLIIKNKIDINEPIDSIIKKLSKYSISTRISLSGEMIVARDIAHAKLKEILEEKHILPDYFKNKIIYYAGPAKTPKGYPSGSFGPTTAGRMDFYLPMFQKHGYSRITLAKGDRSKAVIDSCLKNNGFYLGCIGGCAARIGKDFIRSVETLDFHELGMEAIFKIKVENFPAFILIDNKGNNFFKDIL